MEFYQDLAPYYDQMISFEDRLDTEKKVFHSILKKFPAKTVLDAGCGSGFHTVLFAKLGLEVTGIDISDEMLHLAASNAKKHKIDPVFIKSDFLNMHDIPTASIDAIYCLGNSFVHLLSREELLRALLNFKNSLNDQGYLCIQIINYKKFLIEKREKLSVKQVGDTIFTRTYEYNERTINFNVKIEKPDLKQTITTELYPLQHDELFGLLKEAGFSDIQGFGNLHLDPYEPLKSENLCVFCR